MQRRHPSFIDPAHRGCVICAQFRTYVAVMHRRNVQNMLRVAAASLRASEAASREGGPNKQETPALPGTEVSTAPHLWQQTGGPLSGQSGRQR